MSELTFDKPAGVLVKTTCVDYPGILAGSFFLKGCNLRCPYCYNTGLVLGKDDGTQPLNTVQELFDHLEKRQGILKGLTISGGEPLINPYTPHIIRKARELGYQIKLDTNGTLPDELEAFMNNPELRPDFIAMDLKTTPSKYAQTMCPSFSKFFNNEEHFQNVVTRTAKLVASYPADKREWRTVLVPPLVKKEDITAMANILPPDASWQFAQFQNQNCIDPSYNEIYPYTDQEVADLIEYAKKIIPGSNLR